MNDAHVMTHTGKMFNPFHPDENLICIEDIAHALSMQCRYNGHLKKFYSVAEHSIDVALVLKKLGLPAKTQLLGLLHDAVEAYLSDVPAPVKKYLPDFKNLEDNLSSTIIRKLHPLFRDLSVNDFFFVNLIDKDISIIEARKLLGEAEWNSVETIFDTKNLDYMFFRISSKVAEKIFKKVYRSLLEEIAYEQTRN